MYYDNDIGNNTLCYEANNCHNIDEENSDITR